MNDNITSILDKFKNNSWLNFYLKMKMIFQENLKDC